MKRNFNVTGEGRKALVMKIAELTGERPVYLGMPTAAFQIGCFHVGRNGELSWDGDDGTAEQLLSGLREAGYTAAEEDTAEATDQAGITDSPIAEDDENHLSISIPDNLTDEQFLLLKRLVQGKATLLKHAFETDSVEIEREDGKITFPWFTASDGEHTGAYMIFVTKLVDMAKKAKRVSVQDKEVENERYAMRCFLLRLGFIGAEYKEARKILMENLSGNTAWKSGHPAETSEKTTAEIQAEEGETTETTEGEKAEEVPA